MEKDTGMEPLEAVRGLYTAYEAQFQAQDRKRKPMEGIFGLGGGPGSYPCHEQFAVDLEELLKRTASAAPGPELVRQLLDYIYFAAPSAGRSWPSPVHWMTLAVHGLTLDLIPFLTPEDSRTLYEQYQAAYPRRSRLPAQEKVLKALK